MRISVGIIPFEGLKMENIFPLKWRWRRSPSKRGLRIGYVQFPHIYKIVQYEFKKKQISIIKRKNL
jgi:hypothetical protein